jgi:hypothetical protein
LTTPRTVERGDRAGRGVFWYSRIMNWNGSTAAVRRMRGAGSREPAGPQRGGGIPQGQRAVAPTEPAYSQHPGGGAAASTRSRRCRCAAQVANCSDSPVRTAALPARRDLRARGSARSSRCSGDPDQP